MHLKSPLAPLATAALLLGLTPTLAGPAGASPSESPRPAAATTPDDASDDALLDAPARGERAITQLDDRLPEAAQVNDLTSGELRSLLRSDPTVWVSTEGVVVYIDPAPDPSAADLAAARSATAELEVPAAAAADAFGLHSNPGADRTIFLDFGGADVTGTAWNKAFGVDPGWHPAWDPAGDGSSFNDAERVKIAQVWAMVAEDYAPFGVDVTTEDPGDHRLTRTSASDRLYGTRALITPSSQAWKAVCDNDCTGIASKDTFADVNSDYQPAWVFTGATDDRPKVIAETVSHEVGHNLSLSHDGNGSSSYDRGHGAWAPIMGASYYVPITQWSKGDYASANNKQDDLAIIAGYVGWRTDEAPGSPDSSIALPKAGATSYITSRSDVDSYRLGSCPKGGTATVDPATGANLDVGLTLRSSAGTVLSQADPASAKVSSETASGMGAVIEVPSGSGFTLQVDGVGHGNWSSGYDDYGSIGAYTVAVTGCDSDATTVPGAPTNTSSWWNPDIPRAGAAWQPPASDGGGEITSYVVTLDGVHLRDLPASARVVTHDAALTAGEHTLAIRAVNAAGRGPAATTTFKVPGSSTTTVPQAPTGVSATRGDRSARVRWNAPASGGSPVTGYVVTASPGGATATVRSAGTTRATVSGLTNGRAHTFTVRATSAAGGSASSARSAAVTPAGRPDAVARPSTTLRGNRLVVGWQAPAANGSPVSRYVVRITNARNATVSGGQTRAVLRGLSSGLHKVKVVARNDVGTSRPSPVVRVRVRR